MLFTHIISKQQGSRTCHVNNQHVQSSWKWPDYVLASQQDASQSLKCFNIKTHLFISEMGVVINSHFEGKKPILHQPYDSKGKHSFFFSFILLDLLPWSEISAFWVSKEILGYRGVSKNAAPPQGKIPFQMSWPQGEGWSPHRGAAERIRGKKAPGPGRGEAGLPCWRWGWEEKRVTSGVLPILRAKGKPQGKPLRQAALVCIVGGPRMGRKRPCPSSRGAVMEAPTPWWGKDGAVCLIQG